jgi:hypothetical protein
MKDLEYIAAKSERKLDNQTDEFNRLRDRVLIVAGYSIALLTAIFSFWGNLKEPYTHIVTGGVIISLISIGVLIYAAFSNPLIRGMNCSMIKDIVENEERTDDDFFKNEIAYNLDSFDMNRPLLKKLQYKLNLCLTAQTLVTILTGIAIYLNNINHG